MYQATDISLVGSIRTELGEGIQYDVETDSITWVDIPESRAWQLKPDGQIDQLSLGPEAAFSLFTTRGQILAGADGGFHLNGRYLFGRDWFDPTEVINDGAVHSSGEFLVFGTRDRAEKAALGHMWLLGTHVKRLPWNFTVFNGPAFSPCGSRIYFADSPARTIYVAAVDVQQQTVGERHVFATVPESLGYPDGMTCDEDDGLWSAHWDGGCVTRYFPDGSVDFRVKLPASRITSLAFRHQNIYVTSARDEESVNGQSLDGSLFTFECNVSGPPSPRLDEAVLNSIASTT